MAKYGAAYPKFAPFGTTAETAAALPTYGKSVVLAELSKVADNPTYDTAKMYGDNKLVEDVNEFKEATVDIEITEMSNANAAVVFGATVDTTSSELEFSDSDTAPFGGFAFYVAKQINNVKKYQGVYYPKVKAAQQGEEFNTKGDGITLTGGKLQMTAYTPLCGKWKIKSEDFATEAEAKAWVDEKIPAGA